MSGFAEKGPVPVDGRCLWCGGKLARSQLFSADPREHREGEPGYRGLGHFCTMTCGWRFGLRLAELGRRLRPTEDE